jgi:predicted nuclease with TOPRIM domain
VELLRRQTVEDRTTYRSYSTGRLIEEAKYEPNPELAIALGERLDDIEDEMDERVAENKERADDLQRELNKGDDKLYEAGVEIDKLELMLSQREEEVASLKAHIEQLEKGN